MTFEGDARQMKMRRRLVADGPGWRALVVPLERGRVRRGGYPAVIVSWTVVSKVAREVRRTGGVAMLVFVSVVLGGCARSYGRIAMMAWHADAVGAKLLRPHVEVQSCRANVFGIALDRGRPSIEEALARLATVDGEANVVLDAEIATTTLFTGLYNRHCLLIRGSVARAVPTLKLPAAPSHHGH